MTCTFLAPYRLAFRFFTIHPSLILLRSSSDVLINLSTCAVFCEAVYLLLYCRKQLVSY